MLQSVSKSALRNALLAWLAIALASAVCSLRPGSLPARSFEMNDGTTSTLAELQGRPVGVLVYTSRVASGAHTRVLSQAAQLYSLLKDHPRYAVRVVYGDESEELAREVARGFGEVPVALDPSKRLARELGFEHHGTVLFRDDGRIIEKMADRTLPAERAVVRLLDARTR